MSPTHTSSITIQLWPGQNRKGAGESHLWKYSLSDYHLFQVLNQEHNFFYWSVPIQWMTVSVIWKSLIGVPDWKISWVCVYGLTHWGRVTHICVSQLIIIGSDNGLSPGRRQAITWTNAGILLIEPLGTNFSDILIGIQIFSFKKMSSVKWRPSCLGLNVFMDCG